MEGNDEPESIQKQKFCHKANGACSHMYYDHQSETEIVDYVKNVVTIQFYFQWTIINIVFSIYQILAAFSNS